MPINYQNLDPETRALMAEEIDMDMRAGSIYLSNYLTPQGKQDWPQMLRDAATLGSDATLAGQITAAGRLKQYTQRRNPKGVGMYTARVPVNAPEVMSEGEYNRYYVRALCRRAIQSGANRVTVYRGKQVQSPRPESEAKIGASIDAGVLLADLRGTIGVEPALGVPPGPGSGLTVKLP